MRPKWRARSLCHVNRGARYACDKSLDIGPLAGLIVSVRAMQTRSQAQVRSSSMLPTGGWAPGSPVLQPALDHFLREPHAPVPPHSPTDTPLSSGGDLPDAATDRRHATSGDLAVADSSLSDMTDSASAMSKPPRPLSARRSVPSIVPNSDVLDRLATEMRRLR